MKSEELKLHFVGIGGIGMSGIAEVFLNQGYEVSGSDLNQTETTKRLEKQGARICRGHDAKNVHGTDVVVISSAVKPSNPEVLAAKEFGIPVIPRAEMLGELMRGKSGIAIAGTHGKTTTTSLLASILFAADFDPTVVIGGKVNAIGSNAKFGESEWVIAEADESDGSFLYLPATLAAITNIDSDHMDYYGSVGDLENAFVNFVAKLPFYGAAVINCDDPGVLRCRNRFTKPVLGFSFEAGYDYQIQIDELDRTSSRYSLLERARDSGKYHSLGQIHLSVPGRHNVQNSAAAAILALKMGASFESIQKGLSEYGGVKRRFDILSKSNQQNIAVIDDYGHHPTEVRSTLEMARRYWPDGRVVAVFQPHRFSRTRDCHREFLMSFGQVDCVRLLDIYSAGEAPIDGVSSENLAKGLLAQGDGPNDVACIGDVSTAFQQIKTEMRENDLWIFLGAGTISQLANQVALYLENE